MPEEYVPPKPKAEEPKPDPTVLEEPKPDLDSLLADERAKMEESQKKLDEQGVAYEARMQQLETLLQDKFAGKTPPPDVTAPDTPPTAEDFLTPEGAAEATKRIAAAAANEMGKNIDENYGQTILQTRAAQFDLKLEGIKTRKYYKYVEKKLGEAIKENPKLRYAPEALDMLYTNLVGGATEEIMEGEKEPAEDPKIVHPNMESPRRVVAPATGPDPTPTKDPAVLTADEEDIRSRFAPFIERMRGDGSSYTPEQFAQSRRERSGRADIPTMEDKRAE